MRITSYDKPKNRPVKTKITANTQSNIIITACFFMCLSSDSDIFTTVLYLIVETKTICSKMWEIVAMKDFSGKQD